MIEINIENILGKKPSLTESDQEEFEEAFEEDDEDGDVDEEVGDNQNKNQSKKRKRRTIFWTYQKFVNDMSVVTEIVPKWSKTKTHLIRLGTRVYYKCKHPKCPAKIHLLYFKNQTKIALFHSQGLFFYLVCLFFMP
jgi:hypothetical protein